MTLDLKTERLLKPAVTREAAGLLLYVEYFYHRSCMQQSSVSAQGGVMETKIDLGDASPKSAEQVGPVETQEKAAV